MNYVYLFVLVTSVLAQNWATYPSVPKTASVNGFADPILAELPSCASKCVKFSTSNTPCPYWDTGCLCVMPQWSGMVAQCIVDSCQASDISSATDLAYSLCTKVGANVWMMPQSVSASVSKAAGSGVKNVAASTSVADSKSSDVASGQSSAITSGPSSSENAGTSSRTSSSVASSTGSSSANGAAANIVMDVKILGLIVAGVFLHLV